MWEEPVKNLKLLLNQNVNKIKAFAVLMTETMMNKKKLLNAILFPKGAVFLNQEVYLAGGGSLLFY